LSEIKQSAAKLLTM